MERFHHSPRLLALLALFRSLATLFRAFSAAAKPLTRSFCSAEVAPCMGFTAAARIVACSTLRAASAFCEAERVS